MIKISKANISCQLPNPDVGDTRPIITSVKAHLTLSNSPIVYVASSKYRRFFLSFRTVPPKETDKLKRIIELRNNLKTELIDETGRIFRGEIVTPNLNITSLRHFDSFNLEFEGRPIGRTVLIRENLIFNGGFVFT